jgi:hypothetical protein
MNRPNRKRPDQLRSYAGRTRLISLTEQAVLNDGFGPLCYGHLRSVPELAERLEVSTFALDPHLRSLIEKGEVVAVHEAGRVRYRRRVAA